MQTQTRLERALGQGLAEQRDFEQDFFVIFGNIAGGLQPFGHHPNPSFAALFHGTFQDAFHDLAVSTVHT